MNNYKAQVSRNGDYRFFETEAEARAWAEAKLRQWTDAGFIRTVTITYMGEPVAQLPERTGEVIGDA